MGMGHHCFHVQGIIQAMRPHITQARACKTNHCQEAGPRVIEEAGASEAGYPEGWYTGYVRFWLCCLVSVFMFYRGGYEPVH